MISRLSFPGNVLPRDEAEALLDRALGILRDVYADISHPHVAEPPEDVALRARILALFELVDAKRKGTGPCLPS